MYFDLGYPSPTPPRSSPLLYPPNFMPFLSLSLEKKKASKQKILRKEKKYKKRIHTRHKNIKLGTIICKKGPVQQKKMPIQNHMRQKAYKNTTEFV